MRLVLRIDDTEHPLAEPGHHGSAPTEPALPCPHCKTALLRVVGNGRRIGGRDYYTANGSCVACGGAVGEIRAYMNTLFGLEEDEAVAQRARVY